MAKRHPKRDEIERMLVQYPKRKAYHIATECGLDTEMGAERAVEYIRSVRKALRKKGLLPSAKPEIVPDAERLADITKLFEIRHGKMSKRAAATMLLLNCYYRFRSEDDEIHGTAIDSTYKLNDGLQHPLPYTDAIHICDIALANYMASIDEERNAAAVKHGFPGAGLNYANRTLIDRCEITDGELEHLNTIRKE